jgi:hypothetical protein
MSYKTEDETMSEEAGEYKIKPSEIVRGFETALEKTGYKVTTKQQALIQWIDSTVGGRVAIPEDTSKICMPAKFQGWQSEAWSLYVEHVAGFHDHLDMYRVMIWFLADNAPVEVLRPGTQFALYEGTKIVAVGRCI